MFFNNITNCRHFRVQIHHAYKMKMERNNKEHTSFEKEKSISIQ